MRRNLQPEDLGDLLSQPRIAILATQLPDGSTLLSAVWHAWEQGGFTIVIDGSDAKIRNIRRNHYVSVVVAEDDPPYRGIEIRGEARFADMDASAVLRRLAGRYLKNRDVAKYVDRMHGWTEEAVVLRVEPGVLRAWDFADEEW